MWRTEVKRSCKATREQVWAIWTDVENWKVWDPAVERSSISGPFEKGTSGILKARNGPKSRFRIVECYGCKIFTNRTSLPFCTLDFIHEMYKSEEGVTIIHRIEIKGLLSPLFGSIMGKQQEKDLSVAVDNLIKLLESGIS